MSHAASRVYQRVLSLFGLGKVTSVNDTGPVQRLQAQISSLELQDNLPRVAEFGFTSFPLDGCDAVVVYLGGDRSKGVIIGTNDQTHRPRDLQSGETMIYDATGTQIYLRSGGSIVISPSSGQVTLNGSLVVTGDVTANGISLEHHIHGNVQEGLSNTGAPIAS